MSDIGVGFFFGLVIVVLLYANIIHPNNIKRDIMIEALKTYQLELKAGIKDSKIDAIVKDAYEKNAPSTEQVQTGQGCKN